MNLQPILHNEYVRLVPLAVTDFEALYAIASDPLVWAQHPTKNRYEKDVFKNFFDGAIASKGAFLITNAATDEVIGSSRFYDIDEAAKTATIGYTFFARSAWGKPYNRSAKILMLNYAFEHIDTVFFQIGAENTRSQIAISRFGAQKIGEQDLAYHGEKSNLNFLYAIKKEDWLL
jgi:RimJ/RimL family protein N-acetyltransferase